MYLIDKRDKVVSLNDVPQSSVGAPLPIVLCSDDRLLLGYILEDENFDSDGTTIRGVDLESSDESLALVEFHGRASFMFGSPSDETFQGHPLYSRGLRPYSAFVIEGSSWVRQLERMNSVHPYHRPQHYEQLKHYVFSFHDSTFECVAESFTVTRLSGSLANLLSEMQKRLVS